VFIKIMKLIVFLKKLRFYNFIPGAQLEPRSDFARALLF